MQILEVKKLKLNGSILDAGSKKSDTNVSNYIFANKKISYLNNFSNNFKDLNVDLEILAKDTKYQFNNIFLFNVLEHIYNYQNCLNNCFNFLSKGGFFYGSTPFMYRIHSSPNDYHRFTEQSLRKSLKLAGFKNIEIKVLAGGVGICFYNSISFITNKIPGINNFLLIFFCIIDEFIYIFSKNFRNIMPLGYFFSAEK